MTVTPTFGATKIEKIVSRPEIVPKLKWAVAVTTCDRPEPTLSRTVDSLISTGWKDIDLFSDGPISNSIPKNFFQRPNREGVRVHDRPTRLGAYGNFVCAASELFQTYSDRDYFLFVQDDVVFSKNCRAYLDATLSEKPKGAVWSLYCSGTDYTDFDKKYGDAYGWKETRRGWGMMGALTVVFSAADLISFLSSQSTWLHRITRGPKATRQVDAEIGLWAQNNRTPAMFHHPSLAQHIGEKSSIYPSIKAMSDRRSSVTFVGEDFDALSFLKKNAKPILASPKRKEVQRIGLYGPLGLSPEGFVTARLADIELTRSVLCVPQAGFPVRPTTFETPIIYCASGTNSQKIGDAFRNVDAIVATVPMTPQAISWAKANDKDIVALVTDTPKKTNDPKDNPWAATLRASSLALTPWKEKIDYLGQLGARSVLGAVPAILGASGEDPPKEREGFWGPVETLKQGRHNNRVYFTNQPSKAKEELPEGVHIFNLNSEDHESLNEVIESLSLLFGKDLDGFSLPLAIRDEPQHYELIPDADFSAFLTENIRRF